MKSKNDIQQQLKNKISSQTGASITYALILFLVCAVVSSVVLVSGTAASGRMAQLSEMDQRYYSVSSAAELLKDLMDGKSASIVTVETITSDSSVPGKSDTDTKKYLIGKSAYEIKDSDLESTGYFYRNGAESNPALSTIQEDTAYKIYKGLQSRQFKLTSNIINDPVESMIEENIDCSLGNVVFTVYNDKTDRETDPKYKLMVSFKADKQIVQKTKSSKSGTVTTVVNTSIESYTWEFYSINTTS